ncbi:hypothetical protein [Pseudogemmobacter humi]|uniref:Phage major tail protein 2 n=1 Tax=Pseudogemmobacter humi TaxID=2483812 RepID=A0A3P5XA45_9RHOB|nr:hypothetical protein [Pseudogemmobacter humi]VDC31422.1 Phage major tail protein 2 [Pseudogemmobacter humi]
MAKQAGRLATLKVGASTIAGVRVLNINWNGTPIDTTDQNDAGFQTFLVGVMATDTLELTVEGLEEDQVLRKAALKSGQSAKFIADAEFKFPNGDTITGDFVLTTYTEGQPYDNATSFNATFVRNSAHTFADAPGGGG